MPDDARPLRMLLVSDNPERADRLRQLMEQHDITGELHRVRTGRNAVAQANGHKRFRDAKRFDLVLLDFADADERYLPAVAEIAFARRKKRPPVVLLTSAESERLLSSGELADAANDLFAPLGLHEFLSRAREHGVGRFLSAVRVIARLGPVLVRLPGFLANGNRAQAATKVPPAVECRVA